MSPAALDKPLTLALSKGRIFDETLPLLAAAGIQVSESPESSRKLILPTSDPGLQLIIVRASDVPTYVQYGAADFGIAGKDVLYEHAAGTTARVENTALVWFQHFHQKLYYASWGVELTALFTFGQGKFTQKILKHVSENVRASGPGIAQGDISNQVNQFT